VSLSEGRHCTRSSGGALVRLAAISHAITTPDVAARLYLIPRGETPRAQASSATRRREMADPVKRAEVLARLARSRETEAYREKRKEVPRVRGRWVGHPKRKGPTRKPDRSRLAAASRARFTNPEFRARALAQLALAREKEYARRAAVRADKEAGR
jgi:hypothetical protein